ncbi:MAG: hypothetical protein JRJ12_14350 [Deltaproteobacteria bacterium]|nr:hypothetical protein [Deltaproteobacteria bacterium]MBW2072332.1 hypothetical protein [Deltaproteobacteria bacterium]
MKKTILYRLFKIGRIPKELRPVLAAEGVLVCDEGIAGCITTRDFRALGKRCKYRLTGFSGFLAIRRRRLIAYAYWQRLINVQFEDGKLSAIHAKLINRNRLELSFESSIFHEDCSGRIALRFKTLRAHEFYDVIEKIKRGDSPGDASA